MLQDDLADGAAPSGDQQDEAPQPNALEEEAAAAVRPNEADCKPSNAICTAITHQGLQAHLCHLLVCSRFNLAVSTFYPVCSFFKMKIPK